MWYIQSSTLSIPWETLVNKYAKSGTTPPTPPGTNFHEYNEGKGVSADTVLQRIKNHEYRGTGGNGEGHFAYLEAKGSEDGMDGLAEIEDNAGSSEFLLKVNTWLDLYQIEAAIQGANHEPPAGSNWDGNVWRFNFDASPAVWQEILWKM